MKIDIADDHSWFGWSQWDCRGQIKFSSMGYYHWMFDQAYFSIRRKVIKGGYIRETKKVSNLTTDRRLLVFGFENHYQHTKNWFQVLKGAQNLYYGSQEQRMTFYRQRRYWKTSHGEQRNYCFFKLPMSMQGRARWMAVYIDTRCK